MLSNQQLLTTIMGTDSLSFGSQHALLKKKNSQHNKVNSITRDTKPSLETWPLLPWTPLETSEPVGESKTTARSQFCIGFVTQFWKASQNIKCNK